MLMNKRVVVSGYTTGCLASPRHVASSHRTFAPLPLSSAMYTTRQLSSSSTAEKDDALKAISKVLLCSLDGKGAQMGMALPSIHHPLVSRA